MPKLRDRKSLAASKRHQQESESAAAASSENNPWQTVWTRQEREALVLAVKKHGTFSLDPLVAAVGTRSEYQVRNRLIQQRRDRQQQTPPLPIDAWLDRIANALPPAPVRGQAERLDVSTLTLPLQLAAQEERRQAAMHRREDLSGVYEYLAYLANGKIPPEPSAATSRRLLTLMHHLAALMKNISLSRHKRWIWCNQRLRRLENEHLGPAEEGQPPPRDATDLSLVPPELRGAMSGSLRPEMNCLQIPPALLLSPLATQLNEQATGDKHTLLSQPVHALLADARCHQWGVSWRYKTGNIPATYAARTSRAPTSTGQTSTGPASGPTSTGPNSVGSTSSTPGTATAAPGANGVASPDRSAAAADSLGASAAPAPPATLDSPDAVGDDPGTYGASTPAADGGVIGPLRDGMAQEEHSPLVIEQSLFATPELDLGDSDECPPRAAMGVQGPQTAVSSAGPAAPSGPTVPSAPTVHSDPTVPSLDVSGPGRMMEADMRTGPSFAVNSRGGVMRTYTRKRPLGQRQ